MKKLTSRIFTSLILMSLVVGVVGCGPKASKENQNPGTGVGEGETNQKQSELVLWMPPFGTGDSFDKSFWEGELQGFEVENNVDIKVEIVPWGNYEEKYLTGITSDTGPDVGYMYLEMFSDFIEMGALEPLDRYITEEDKEDYLYLDKGFVSGQQYALPMVVGNTRVLVFNMDLLADAGITELPQTWDEFIETGKAIAEKTPDVIPFYQQWADPAIGALNNVFYPFLWQAGGQIFNEEGTELAVDSPEGLEAAQFLYDLKHKHKLLPDSAMSVDINGLVGAFNEGKVAMAILDQRYAVDLDNYDIKWDFIPSLTNKQGGTFVAADALIMTSNSNNKDLAAKLMKYMTSGGIMEAFHTRLIAGPPVKNDESYNDDPRFKDIYENNAQDLITLPAVSGSFKAYDALYKNLQLMMLDELTPEEALKQSVEYSRTVLSE